VVDEGQKSTSGIFEGFGGEVAGVVDGRNVNTKLK